MSDVNDLLRSVTHERADHQLTVRPIYPGEEHAAQALVARCHPGWPERPLPWFFAYATLVALDDTETMIGCASFSIDSVNIMHLKDTGVAPAVRRRGVARELMAARVGIGELLGVGSFIGVTWEANTAMRSLLDSFGFHACQRLPRYFAHNNPPVDGIVYVRAKI